VADGGTPPSETRCSEDDGHTFCDNAAFDALGAAARNVCSSVRGVEACVADCGHLEVDLDNNGTISGAAEEAQILACPSDQLCTDGLARELAATSSPELLGLFPSDSAGPFGGRGCEPNNCTDGQPCPAECGPGTTECFPLLAPVNGSAGVCMAPKLSCEPVADGGVADAGAMDSGASVDAGLDGGAEAGPQTYAGDAETGVRCGDSLDPCAAGVACCLDIDFTGVSAACSMVDAGPLSDAGSVDQCPAETPIGCDGDEDCGGGTPTCCYQVAAITPSTACVAEASCVSGSGITRAAVCLSSADCDNLEVCCGINLSGVSVPVDFGVCQDRCDP
jgi:hypothetical protein